MLLLDEPLGALDLKLRKEMQLELKALQREVGITFVYVTHDQEEALTMSDVIVVMRDGRIQQQGGPTELYERPVNRFVADFIGSSNFMAGDRRGDRAGAADASSSGRTAGWPARLGHRSDREPGRRPGCRHRRDPAGAPRGRARPARRSRDRHGWTAVPGRIHQGTYLGDQTEFRVQTDRRANSIVRRQNATGAGSGQGMGPGDPVVVRWHEEANLVLVG